MKWNPIIDGDLSGIPKYEHFLFTIDDELGVKSYVVCGEVRGIIEDLFVWGGRVLLRSRKCESVDGASGTVRAGQL